MCLAIPVKIVGLNGETALVETGGVRREANVSLIEDPAVGEFVIVHAGFAIQKWTEDDVKEWQDIVDGMQAAIKD